MLRYGLRLKCPRCGVGRLFRKAFRMYQQCRNCGLKFEREQGYFIGAMYINYGATVAIAVPGFFLLDAFASLTIDQQLALWVPFAIIFPLAFFHHARSLWLVLDYFFNPAQPLYPVPPKKTAGHR
jgi:uncharacterized protein (DUF983 family)